MPGRVCVAALVKIGFAVDRQRGSHIILKRNYPPCRLVVPDHLALDKGTLRAILRQAAITVDEFNELL